MPEELTAGLDEAGRGCLAGPVVAAAVILPRVFSLPGLNDSKLVPARKREALAAQIRSTALGWSLGIVWPQRIDEINILNASLEAMARAALTMPMRPARLCLDGPWVIPERIFASLGQTGSPVFIQKAIIHGDRLHPAISAASILAKTYRDKLMRCLARKYPGYGLETHKGYATRAHLAALRSLGPSHVHRKTFRGVREVQLRLLP